MQISLIKSTRKNLRQGTIVSLSRLSFENPLGEKLTFQTMYPELNMKGVKYCIILSQTCDLVNDGKRSVTTPFINIALLEPIQRYFEENFESVIREQIKKSTLDFKTDDSTIKKLINKNSVIDQIKLKFNRIFQNNEKFFFFISIQDKKKLSLYTVNLTKSFPLRSTHYTSLASKAKFQLKPFFENKLGWKLADIYGRVGTPDYAEADLKKLSEILFVGVKPIFKDAEGIEVEEEDFNHAKGLIKAKVEKRKNFFVSLMKRIPEQTD